MASPVDVLPTEVARAAQESKRKDIGISKPPDDWLSRAVFVPVILGALQIGGLVWAASRR